MTQPRVVPDAPAVVQQLERLLASREFDASSRGRALLGFLVRETQENGEESLSLATIARRVFRRHEDFDSHLDPAVRIEVARLRRALDRYYRLPGPRIRSASGCRLAPASLRRDGCSGQWATPARGPHPLVGHCNRS